MSDRVWFLAAGGKTVGPMSAERVCERISSGKVPPRTKAWKEGMAEWALVQEIADFKLEGGAVLALAEPPALPAREGAAPKPPANGGARPPRPAAPKPAAPAAPREAPPASKGLLGRATALLIPDDVPLSFAQPHRIERADCFRAFGLGLDRSRIALASFTVLGSVIPFFPLLGVGALSYQSREQVLGRETPGVRAALGFAWKNAGALVGVPLFLSVAMFTPVVLLAILSLFMKIPYAGPIGNGAIYGLHIALGAATLFLLLASALSWVFTPVIVAFEETTFRGTIQVLFDFVRRSALRVYTWAILPAIAFEAYALGVLLLLALAIAIPLGMNFAVLGLDGVMRGPGQVAGLVPALVPIALWIVAALVGFLGLLFSVQNALLSILYLGGRRGNDDLVTRDAWLARRTASSN